MPLELLLYDFFIHKNNGGWSHGSWCPRVKSQRFNGWYPNLLGNPTHNVDFDITFVISIQFP